jgi:TonB family protein
MSSAVSWTLYVLVISALFGVGALLLERAARLLRGPGRWGWIVALVGSVLVPFWSLFDVTPAPAVTGFPVLSLPGLTVGGSSGVTFDVTGYAAGVWAVLSGIVLILLASSFVALRRAARGWEERVCEETPVWVSETLGPAVLGLTRQRIVVPRWVLTLPEESRRLLLLHEREHARAGDARLVVLAYLAAVAFPWNPVVWWQVGRLRHAIEMDCDARVLRRGGSIRSYGALLLTVGGRRSGQPLLAAAFGERSTRLEQRIRTLLEHTNPRRCLRGLLYGGVGLLLLTSAYCVRDPVEQQVASSDAESARMPARLTGSEGRDSGAAVQAPSRKRRKASGADPGKPQEGASLQRKVGEQPSFTPMTQRPELLDLNGVQQALADNYPPALRDAGIGGRTLIWFLIDETGVVRKTQLKESSGRAELDSAALRLASQLRFRPAENDGVPVPVWVEIPVQFEAR